MKFKRILGVPILVIFMNMGFLIYAKEVFSRFITIIPIFLFNTFISLDIVIRPISKEKDEYKRSISALTFLSMPIMIALPYFEYKYFIKKLFPHLILGWITLIGSIILILGGVLLIIGRIYLGKYGGPKITIEGNHQLITSGIYNYIRHPIYLSFLLLFFGYSLALGSLIMTLVLLFILFLIFKSRMELEEGLLMAEFGEKYLDYIKSTKRLLPYIY